MEKEKFKDTFEAKKKELEVKKQELAAKREREEEEDKKGIDALVTARVLFISALDKIYNIILLLMLVGATIVNFKGDITSLSYGFFGRVGREIISLICLFIVYLFFNWLYKCVSKTMLCVTKNQVYKEKYIPFKRKELSIPLNKITGVSTLNVLWIFRSVTIHQYGKLPMIFFTWKNKEVKDAITALITTEKDKVKNDHENKNLLSKDSKLLRIVCVVLAGAIVLLSIIRFFGYMFNAERRIAGTYKHKDAKIVLKSNGTCNIDDFTEKDVTECAWTYDKDSKKVSVAYTYDYTSSYFGTLSSVDYLSLDYNKDNKSLTYNSVAYKK